MSVTTTSIEELSINTIRTLSMDAVQQADSGHPGTPMALAPVAYQLWNHHLKYDPATPHWPVRDRFVLSCGHASMLLYSLLHLAGVNSDDNSGELSITLDNIRDFRQSTSPCAGHPEHSYAAGIETTTGPLGQGVGNSVGMAIAGKWFAGYFDRPGFEMFGFNVYALCSDGDLMEGISNEAASLAGHLKLSNLCWIYDDNRITIEGATDLAYSDNAGQRFEGLGWRVLHVDDANDLAAMETALETFEKTQDAPTLIIVRSHIGYGAPNKQDTAAAHGSPLGEDEIRLAKAYYGWPEDEKFLVPDGVPEHFAAHLGRRGGQARQQWDAQLKEYGGKHPELAQQFQQIVDNELPQGWDSDLPVFEASAKGTASRGSSGKVINAIAKKIPWFMGGSADLAGSTKTLVDGAASFSAGDYTGRNFHFGIREHAMAAACNGMALCGLRPYGATFFVFTDYLRPALRLSSIMHQPVLYVLTHDSIGLGEDGPTHQPIEHLAACRAIPGLYVMRPGDANEVSECYRTALNINDHPVAMVLTRQDIPTFDRSRFQPAAGTARGGYILADAANGKPEVILMATGSELAICVEAYEKLTADGVKARVVSLPCFELFDQQDEAYRKQVLPPEVTARVACEAGIEMGWDRYLGQRGKFVGLSTYGASAPFEELYERFGLTSTAIAAAARELI